MAASVVPSSPLAEKLVAVIGGGVSGLACASKLAEKGFPVTVFDMGRGPGGRMSRRRERTPDGKDLYFDHGAQYFTVKDPAVQQMVDDWEAAGIVAEWRGKFGTFDASTCRFTADPDNGKKRYVGVPGMNAVCKAMCRQPGVRAKFGVTVTKMSWEEDRTWLLSAKNGENLGKFWGVVAADKNLASSRFSVLHGCPPPLAGAGLDTLAEKVAFVTASPSFAVLMAFTNPLSSVPFDGFSVIGSKVLSWVSRDSSKPGRQTNLPDGWECWVLQSTMEYASGIIERSGLTRPSDELLASVADALLKHFQSIADIPEPMFMKAHRWGSAFPNSAIATEEKCLFSDDHKVAICGDFCLSPKVEGAILSGLATASKFDLLLKIDS